MHSLKGGSLAYAIFLALMVAIICSSMILLMYMNRSYFYKMDQFSRVKDDVYSGLAYLKSLDQSHLSRVHAAPMDNAKSIWMRKSVWGAYEVIAAQSSRGNISLKKAALIGYNNEWLGDVALWLTDNNQKLKLSGNARIKGNCFLPKRGVGAAFVEGQHFTGNKLIQGLTKYSTANTPKLRTNYPDYWNNHLKFKRVYGDSVVEMESLVKEFERSFVSSTLLAFSDKEIVLDNRSLSGNIIIQSSRAIIVDSSSWLNQVTLVAPVIRVRSNVKGGMHLVATESIIIDEGAVLNPPSSIIILNDPSDKAITGICELKTHSSFSGTIINLAGQRHASNKSNLRIEKDALVKGIVYCLGNLELRGTVKGTVIANKLFLKTPTGVYENHLLNGKILRTGLVKQFPTIKIEDTTNKALVATWLK